MFKIISVFITIGYLITIPILFYFGKISTAELLTFLGIIPLGVIALYQEQFKRWFFSPKLIIEFNHEEPFSIRTELREINTGKLIAYCYYFRFRVYNAGRSQARLCEAIIEEFWEGDSVRWNKPATFQPVNLIWSNNKSKDEFLNINPHARWFCDIGSIKKHDTFRFEVMFKPYSQPETIRYGLHPNRKCKIKVALYSENASKTTVEFLIRWSGKWSENPEEMFKEVIIQKL